MSKSSKPPGNLWLAEELWKLNAIEFGDFTLGRTAVPMVPPRRARIKAQPPGRARRRPVSAPGAGSLRQPPPQASGVMRARLCDELTGEIIADSKHLPPTLMKLAYRCKGPDRLCAVSDAIAGAGLAEGSRFTLAGNTYDVCDGVGMLPDRTAFAGSVTLLSRMLPILVDAVGVPLVEAVRMVTLTPARIIGWAERKGSLEAGKDADVSIFEDDFTVWRTMIGGRWAYG